MISKFILSNLICLLLCTSSISVTAQSYTMIGKIEYTYETLQTSGNYKETSKSDAYFTDGVYCTRPVSKPNDTNALVERSLKLILQAYESNNIPLDSFEVDKHRRKIKADVEQHIKTITPLPFTFHNTNDEIIKRSFKLGNDKYCVIDTLNKVDVELTDDTMTIEGLFCQKAKAVVNKRPSNIWFAPSIPFQASPAAITALPGIVVLIESEDKQRRAILTKLEYPLSQPMQATGCTGEKEVSWAEYKLLQEKNKKERMKELEERKKNFSLQ